MNKIMKFRMISGENGGSLVEMATCCMVLMPLMFGVIQFSLAFYAYHFVAEAAREGSRYAMVRGSQSCKNTPNLDNACSTSNGATASDIQTWVQNLGYPMAKNLSVTAAWYSYSADTNGHATWAACAGQCSIPGNQVKVTVVDNYSLAVPYWKTIRVPLQSTSTMVISQ